MVKGAPNSVQSKGSRFHVAVDVPTDRPRLNAKQFRASSRALKNQRADVAGSLVKPEKGQPSAVATVNTPLAHQKLDAKGFREAYGILAKPPLAARSSDAAIPSTFARLNPESQLTLNRSRSLMAAVPKRTQNKEYGQNEASRSGAQSRQIEEDSLSVDAGRLKAILTRYRKQHNAAEPSDEHAQKVLNAVYLLSDALENGLDPEPLLNKLRSKTVGKNAPCPSPPPPLPPGRSWPKETFSEANSRRRIGIIEFLEDPNGWFPLISDGLVTRNILRAVDPSAERAVNAYTKAKRGNKFGAGKRDHRHLPPHLDIPTQQELTDRRIKAAGGAKRALKADRTLAHAIAGRIRRGSSVPGL